MHRQQKINSFFKKTPKRESLQSPQTVVSDTKTDSDKNDNPKVPSSRVEAITLSSDEEDMKVSFKSVPTFLIADESDNDKSFTTVNEPSTKETEPAIEISSAEEIVQPLNQN